MAQTLNAKKRKTRNPRQSQTRILRAAEKLFSERGFDAGVDDIAERAGLNKRMIYHYFKSKQGLWNAVLLHQYQKAQLPELGFSTEDDLVTLIETLVDRYFRFLAADPCFVRLLMFENLRRGKSIKAIPVAKTKVPILQTLSTALKTFEKRCAPDNLLMADQLLIDIIALCFFFFSNQSTLSAVLGEDLSGEYHMEQRIKHVKTLLRYALSEILRSQAQGLVSLF
ncbi:MAG: TetR/AcrR family transcriptional regulator [Phycisphaerae bacterium]